jgi:hypothetical protein
MTTRSALRNILMTVALSCSVADAQWSIGAPGSREAPPGMHRYIMLVFAKPIPGREA